MSGDDADFAAPDFGADVSLEAYVAACPEGATTRGLFFESVQKVVHSELGRVDADLYAGLDRQRWTAFKTYPLRDFLKLAHNAVRLAFPRVHQGEALRRLGWQCYPTFAASLAGRVALFAFGQDLQDMITSLPKSYALALPDARVTVHRLGDGHARIELREVYSFAGTYHVGVIEGPSRASGTARLQVLVKRYPRISDVDLDLRWTRV